MREGLTMPRFALFLLLFPSIVCAVDLYVPDDFVVIQDAIDAANEGDVVIVRDGVWTGFFNKDLDFSGKAITVRSENGPEDCIIDCEGVGRGFWIHLSEPTDAILDGFTILNSGDMGAIYVQNAQPTIRNCVVRDSHDIGVFARDSNSRIANCEVTGGDSVGIYVKGNNSNLIENCRITGNIGGGVFLVLGQGHSTLRSCLVMGNSASQGGGVAILGRTTVIECTIVNNVASAEGGGILASSPDIIIRGTTVWGNTAPTNDNIHVLSGPPPQIRFSNIQGGYNGLGNIDEDPMFVDDFHLGDNSPCIDSGDPDFVPEPNETDLDGDPRVVNGRVDMGADEFTDFGECGNGIVEAGEECDPPDGTTCDETCHLINDVDGDGVLDEDDVCSNTPLAIPVDATGRPVGDIDLDCDVDLSDFAALQGSFTGPLE